jgi:hypothetical protein
METPISTKKSAEPAQLYDRPLPQKPAGLELELPAASDFVSIPPKADAESMLELCEYFLPEIMSRPGYFAQRVADRCLAEFDLDHPERVPATYPAQLIDEILSGVWDEKA